MLYKGTPATSAPNRQAWRDWLTTHHATTDSVWLIIYKKDSGEPTVYYPEAVDEALCFGWVDSLPNKRDANSYYQYFSRRNPKSNWSRVNKEKVARLVEEDHMAPAGYALVELAKETGTWDALNEVEDLIVPPDLQLAFDANPTAFRYWKDFPASTKRGILEWIFNAKLPATRKKRVVETVSLAEKNERANQYRK